MNTGKYIFAQRIEFLPQRIFDRIVMKYEGNKYVKHFHMLEPVARHDVRAMEQPRQSS